MAPDRGDPHGATPCERARCGLAWGEQGSPVSERQPAQKGVLGESVQGETVERPAVASLSTHPAPLDYQFPARKPAPSRSVEGVPDATR